MTRCGATALGRRAVVSAFALTLLGASLVGCSAASPSAHASRIDVTMHDFGIKMSRRSVPAGMVVLHVTNNGPSTHEINVDLTSYQAGKIPLKLDGLTAAEDARGLKRIDSIEQVNLHRTEDLTLDLQPGRYVLWCNLEGHYLGGMHETFDVR
jgi:uncharacterized cupredoxin-like copper-binding protein